MEKEGQEKIETRSRSINGIGIIIPQRFPRLPSTPTICEDLKKKIDHLTMMLKTCEYYPRPDSLFWKLHSVHRKFSLSTERDWHSFWYKYRGCEEIGDLEIRLKKEKSF